MSRIKTIARNLRLLFSRDLIEIAGEIEERLNQRAGQHEQALDARIDERFAAIERQIDGRVAAIEVKFDERAGNYESALDARIDERLAGVEVRLDQRFDERARANDNRLDDRIARIERQIDERYGALEQQTDERMERHERKVDAMIRRMSNDVVDRNDIMLQLFEQRLDQQRRDLRALREHSPAPASSSVNPETEPAIEENSNNGDSPNHQLTSFRKLADVTTNIRTKIKSDGHVALYHQILDWKKVAQDGLDHFTPDEQETVDYILSFLDDPKEIHYVKQHLRRFVSTLQRIPPARRGAERLLELGSLSHLAPAIRKYCGYKEVACADFWNSDEKIEQQTVQQKTGPKNGLDSYTFELRNFNVERDPFPYPDRHFHVALCCELIEHLQSDPMHMLWECNRVLEDDGYLLLTTPNIACARAIEGLLVGCAPYLLAQYNVREIVDQHNREYAPYEIGVALAAAGFSIVELETEDVWLRSNPAILDLLKQVQISTELRGDNIFALARKTGAPIERYPKELYID